MGKIKLLHVKCYYLHISKCVLFCIFYVAVVFVLGPQQMLLCFLCVS